MTVDQPPHRPTDEEHATAVQMQLDGSDQAVEDTLGLVQLALAQGQHDKGIDLLKSLVLARPDDASLYEVFGVLHQGAGDFEAAEVCFAEAHRVDGHAVVANLNLGELAWRKHGDKPRALVHLERVCQDAAGTPFADRASATLTAIHKK